MAAPALALTAAAGALLAAGPSAVTAAPTTQHPPPLPPAPKNQEKHAEVMAADNKCLQIQADWNYCSGLKGHYIDTTLSGSPASALVRRAGANDARSWTQVVQANFARYFDLDAKTMGSDEKGAKPIAEMFRADYHCPGYTHEQRRYLVSIWCVDLVSQSHNACGSAGPPQAPVLCQSTCYAYMETTIATLYNTTQCPNIAPNEWQARTDGIIAAQHRCLDAPFNGPLGNCTSGDEIEPYTRGVVPALALDAEPPSGGRVSGASADDASGSSANTINTPLGPAPMVPVIVGAVFVLLFLFVIGIYIWRRRGGRNRPSAAAAYPSNGKLGGDNDNGSRALSYSAPYSDSADGNNNGGAPGMQSPPQPSPHGPLHYSGSAQPQWQGAPQSPRNMYDPSAQQHDHAMPPLHRSPGLGPHSPHGHHQDLQYAYGVGPQSPEMGGGAHLYQPPPSPGGMTSSLVAPQSAGGTGMHPAYGNEQSAVSSAQHYHEQQMHQQQQEQQQQQQQYNATKRISSLIVDKSVSLKELLRASLAHDDDDSVLPPVPDISARSADQTSSVVTTASAPALTQYARPRQYRVLREYVPTLGDEMELVEGDVISVSQLWDDGWALGFNLCTGQAGVLPLSFVEQMPHDVADLLSLHTRHSQFGDLSKLQQLKAAAAAASRGRADSPNNNFSSDVDSTMSPALSNAEAPRLIDQSRVSISAAKHTVRDTVLHDDDDDDDEVNDHDTEPTTSPRGNNFGMDVHSQPPHHYQQQNHQQHYQQQHQQQQYQQQYHHQHQRDYHEADDRHHHLAAYNNDGYLVANHGAAEVVDSPRLPSAPSLAPAPAPVTPVSPMKPAERSAASADTIKSPVTTSAHATPAPAQPAAAAAAGQANEKVDIDTLMAVLSRIAANDRESQMFVDLRLDRDELAGSAHDPAKRERARQSVMMQLERERHTASPRPQGPRTPSPAPAVAAPTVVVSASSGAADLVPPGDDRDSGRFSFSALLEVLHDKQHEQLDPDTLANTVLNSYSPTAAAAAATSPTSRAASAQGGGRAPTPLSRALSPQEHVGPMPMSPPLPTAATVPGTARHPSPSAAASAAEPVRPHSTLSDLDRLEDMIMREKEILSRMRV